MRQLKITKQITHRTEQSIGLYFQEINKLPLITADEEVELSVRIRNGDEEALERLVSANLRFVISVAKQYQNRGLSFPDLINEGNVGLVKAAKKFDETKGFKFISYAVWWIRQSIIQAIAEQTRMVRLPLNRVSSIKKITSTIPYLEQQFEREPTDEEIAGALNLSSEKVKASHFHNQRHISLDTSPSNDEQDDSSLYDLIQNKETPDPDNQLMEESLETNIHRALKKLSKREATIIIMFYGLGNTQIYSLHRIASHFNMSSERIRQIKSKSLIKLKALLQGKECFME
ncbi:MAG: RNA polymerase sigma factor RpoD/SigA [Bacteroidales bacterium]|jgi:RNA polymerase primary sigma factor|nr:sigma-70 family RNA polymerase sigma factor [Bacteroidales bacterium]MBS3776042.1 sigma-70 family RNA polymerase sigma factor [Bacteroidales bacterium]